MELQEQMQELVDLFHKSGKSQKAFSREHGIGDKKFNYWVRKLSQEGKTSSGFITVAGTGNSAGSSGAQPVEILYPNGVKVKASGADLSLLRQLIHLY